MNGREIYKKIRNVMKNHNNLFKDSIPLIASENVTSWAMREALLSDLAHRYAEGVVGKRVYAGCHFIDEIETITLDLLKEIYEAEFADVRPVSGVVANLTVYTAFSEPGDTMMATSIPSGGHISHAPKYAKSGKFVGGTAGTVHGLNIEYFPYDKKEFNIDVDAAIKKIKEVKPKLLQFGASVFLFPHPVKELAEAAREVDATILYDSAHVSGLIAGKQFQQPLKEGADAMTLSTHKTLFGPQHGAVLSWEKYAEKIQAAAFPGLTSNHHLHNVAALGIALAEFKEFGEAYAKQVIKNAKALAEELHANGFKVCAEHKGFTESHTILVDITNLKDKVGLGGDIERLLEKANIIININLLPWYISEGRGYMNPGGIRLGTSELTRVGMKESEMKYIAELFKKLLFDLKPPEDVKKEVIEFKKDYQHVHYTFHENTEAYKFIELVKE